jgi:hypothetical protein
VGGPTVTQNSSDVTDPGGNNEATKVVFNTVPNSGTDYCMVFANLIGGAVASTCGSVYARTLSGTATIYLSPNQGTPPATMNVTSTWQRFSLSSGFNGILIGADTRPANGDTPGITGCTVYLWGAQVESTGIAFPTSLIRTAAVAATRDADIVTVATNPLPADPAAYSMGTTITPVPGATLLQVNAVNTGQSGVGGWGTWPNPNGLGIYVDSRIVTLEIDAVGSYGYFQTLTNGTGAVTNKVGASWTTAPSASGLPSGGTVYAATGNGHQLVPGSPVVLNSIPGGTWPFYGHITDFIVDNTVLYP